MNKRKRKFDSEALVVIIVSGILISLGSTTSHPLINIPKWNKPKGVWIAKIARAHKTNHDMWYGPLLSPIKRELRLLEVEITVYKRYINNLHSKTNISSLECADLIIYKSNLCVATELITNTSALKTYLKTNNRDQRESWHPWLLRILLFTLIAGVIIGAFIFYLLRFIRGLIGYKCE